MPGFRRGHIALAIVLTTLLLGGVSPHAASGRPSSAGTPIASTCPVTPPNGLFTPDPIPENFKGGYGTAALWTNVRMWGEDGVILPHHDSHVTADGAVVGLKWAWFRTVSGKLAIEGRRLDGPSEPLIADIPDGYGLVGFQVTGLTFPSPGCWQVTGSLAHHRLTFVVWVEVIGPTATPRASRSS